MKKQILFLLLLGGTTSASAQGGGYFYGLSSRSASLCIAGEPRDAVVVSGTVPHSPSAQADIRPFDVILSVNGTPVETQESLSGLLRSAPRAEFQIRRLGNQ